MPMFIKEDKCVVCEGEIKDKCVVCEGEIVDVGMLPNNLEVIEVRTGGAIFPHSDACLKHLILRPGAIVTEDAKDARRLLDALEGAMR